MALERPTLLKVIIGLLKPREGGVYLEGEEIKPAKKASRKLLGYCPQENSFFDRLTVKENLKFFADLYNVKEESRLAEDLASSLHLHTKINEMASRLSGGMKRRLNIGCSLVHNPQILLLDEPSIELDPFSRHSLWKLIRNINKAGTTVIVSTNSMEEANSLCSSVAFLLEGNVRYVGNPRNITKLMEESVWPE